MIKGIFESIVETVWDISFYLLIVGFWYGGIFIAIFGHDWGWYD